MNNNSPQNDLNVLNLDVAEEMYAKFLADPATVDPTWQLYFNSLNVHEPHLSQALQRANSSQSCLIENLINAYRTYGHLMANINPLAISQPDTPRELQLTSLGFTTANLIEEFPTLGLMESSKAPLNAIIEYLKNIYAGRIGVEFMGLQNKELEKFVQEEMENGLSGELTLEEKQMILQQLNKSELLEVFLHTKYVGQKRFSLEGSETLIPMLEALLEFGSASGVEEFYIGMSHRGRLNVLTNILDKSYTEIFSEFDENYIPESFEGSYDVKYHKGFASEIKTDKKTVKVSLTPNPSHLESVDSVVEGQVKARQIITKDEAQEKILPVLIHGDAAVCGQGVVYETLQFCKLKYYSTGGTLHFVVNNQIGFTTLPTDSRSTLYCTDIAKTFGAPVFHVNLEDPEKCIFATELSLKIRQKFHVDVFIDLNCYRKYGHNESDEPAFTQPIEYKQIRSKKPVREIYRDQLIEHGFLEKEIALKLESEFKLSLQEALSAVNITTKNRALEPKLSEIKDEPFKTSVPQELLREIALRLSDVPNGFNIHPKVSQLVKNRLSMVEENKSIDWGMAESLAYGTLLWEGTNIRLSGQDSCRGTFSHRHGLWVDQLEEKQYFPLQHLKESQGTFDLINSPLSEFAVLGFEYGYNIMTLGSLTIWEAQFGDFANGAQVMIDQYIASAEQKWGQRSSLVMLLPHGYEGQGPEHSSGRLERFLSLAGNNNMQVVNPTTPAQLFHLLRRQILGKIFKPLIVFTPKGLLRHPACVSVLSDLSDGNFNEVIDDMPDFKNAKKLIFCSGRIYYDLVEKRAVNKILDIAFVRIEQLYPLDTEKLKEIIGSYKNIQCYFYVQEEPSNMGAWEYIRPFLDSLLPEKLKSQYIGRNRSASPATGSHALHDQEYASIMDFIKGDN
jgi:2-oxoglutarate dehydrogenase E1 component